jgi:hypothetical protein
MTAHIIDQQIVVSMTSIALSAALTPSSRPWRHGG